MRARIEQEGFLRVERAVEYLMKHHDRVLGVLMRARDAMLAADVPEGAKVAQLRWEMVRTIREYQLFKHGEIFDPLLRDMVPARRTAAQALKSRCLTATWDYDEHVRRWTLFGIVNDWPQYRRESLALFDRLERHFTSELAAIRDLMAGLERLR